MLLYKTRSHDQSSRLSIKHPSYRKAVDELMGALLKQDLIDSPRPPKSKIKSHARLIAKSRGVLAGVQECRFIIKRYFKSITIVHFQRDGDLVNKGDSVIELKGYAHELLALERTLVNLVSRMSGVATLTSLYVAKIKYGTALAATRKTLWGVMDKRAVSLGGGLTHRLSLFDAIMIKDNDIALCGGDIEGAIKAKLANISSNTRFFEVEADTLSQAMSAARILFQLSLKKKLLVPVFVLLDNFSPQAALKCIDKMKKEGVKSSVGVELSGGVNIKNVHLYDKVGADIISIGRLTHSASMLDMSFEINA